MNAFATMVIALIASLLSACEAGVLAAAPAAIGYTHAIPQNIPPFASRLDIETRFKAAPFVGFPAAPAFAAPAAPFVAAPAAPFFAPAPPAAFAPALAPYALPAPFFRR